MRFSIITINLNNLRGLRKTMESVLSQTNNQYEWIVIDGGSTDGSVELIKEHQDNITYWVSEPDNGIYHAMNKGIREAKGDYLLFLNSGDYLVNSTVLRDVFDANRSEDIVYGLVESEIEGRIQILTCFSAKDDITLGDFYYHYLPHQATFFKSSLFKTYGLYDESLHIVGDIDFYFRTIIYGNVTVKFLPIIVSYFEGGGLSSTFAGHSEERRKILNKYVPPRIYRNMMDALSKKDICYNKFFTLLYSILYKTAIYFRK